MWTRRLAVLGALLAVGAVILPRRGGDAASAVLILAAGLACAVGALVAAVLASIEIWRTGNRGAGRMAAGVCLAIVTLSYPATVMVTTIRDNPATDVTTDRANPPDFAASDAAAGAVAGLDLNWLLGRDRPTGDAEPLTIDQDPAKVYRTVLKAATQLHWRVTSATAPTPRTPLGHVDAVTYSAVMRLPERIAIRIGRQDGQTRVDLRAVAGGILPLVGDDPLRNLQAFADAIEDQEAEN